MVKVTCKCNWNIQIVISYNVTAPSFYSLTVEGCPWLCTIKLCNPASRGWLFIVSGTINNLTHCRTHTWIVGNNLHIFPDLSPKKKVRLEKNLVSTQIFNMEAMLVPKMKSL